MKKQQNPTVVFRPANNVLYETAGDGWFVRVLEIFPAHIQIEHGRVGGDVVRENLTMNGAIDATEQVRRIMNHVEKVSRRLNAK